MHVAYQVLTEIELPDEMVEMLGDDSTLHVWPESESEVEALLPSIHGLLTYGHPIIDGATMDRMPNLAVISNFGVGVDHIDLDAARQRGIPVGNTPHILDGATADLTFALLMAIARNIVVGNQYARSPAFTAYNPDFLLGQEVHDATLGIVGMGNIGRQVARRASGFDMTVLYHNRNRYPQYEAELGVTYASLPDLLRQADFVTLNVPLTEETTDLIGAAELQQMKPTAFLINVARGAVVDQEALLTALQSGEIAGAALDVTEPEPLPRDHPLLSLDNVIILPHLGSATVQTRQAMAQLTVDNLKAGLKGEELPSRIA